MPSTLQWAVRRAVSAVLRDGQPVWARVKRPVGAVVASAARLGLSFVGGATISCGDGSCIDLASDPQPLMLKPRGARYARGGSG